MAHSKRLQTRPLVAALLATVSLSILFSAPSANAEEVAAGEAATPAPQAGAIPLDESGLPDAPFTIRYSAATESAFQRDAESGDIAMIGTTLSSLISQSHDIHPKDIVAPELDLTKRFDVLLRPGPEGGLDPQKMLKLGLTKAMNLTANRTMREGPINRLRPAKGAPQLEPSTAKAAQVSVKKNRLEATATRIAELASFLRWQSPRPIVDESGLDATYDFVLEWDESAGTAALFHSLNDIGLEIVPDEGTYEVLEVLLAK